MLLHALALIALALVPTDSVSAAGHASPLVAGGGAPYEPPAPCLVAAARDHRVCIADVEADPALAEGELADEQTLCALRLYIRLQACFAEEVAVRKLRTGSTALFRWEAPSPVAEAPVLTVQAGADVVAGVPALAVAVAPGTVDTISADRRRLTLVAPLVGTTARAAGPEWGEAHLVTPAGGVFAVRVGAISDDADVVTLADPLPRSVDPTGATLAWASWWTTFTADDVTAGARRDIRWTVTARPLHAGSAGAEATEDQHFGRIAVVDRPFSTGVTTGDLARRFPDLASTVAGRDNSRAGILDAALDRLALDLRPHLRPHGLWEDDIDGEALALAHGTLAAAWILDRTEPERADRLRKDYAEALDQGLRAIWADLDADGVIDDGETLEATGAVPLAPQRLSTLFASARPLAPTWSRGRDR